MSLWQKYSDQGRGTKYIWFAILVTVCHCMKVSKAGGWDSWSYPFHIQGHFCSPRFRFVLFLTSAVHAFIHSRERCHPQWAGSINNQGNSPQTWTQATWSRKLLNISSLWWLGCVYLKVRTNKHIYGLLRYILSKIGKQEASSHAYTCHLRHDSRGKLIRPQNPVPWAVGDHSPLRKLVQQGNLLFSYCCLLLFNDVCLYLAYWL